jgi:hypothetical protein
LEAASGLAPIPPDDSGNCANYLFSGGAIWCCDDSHGRETVLMGPDPRPGGKVLLRGGFYQDLL